MNLTNKDITDYSDLLHEYDTGRVYLAGNKELTCSKVVQDLGLEWLEHISSKQDPRHLSYKDSLLVLKEYIDSSPYVFLHTDLNDRVVGCIVLGEIQSIHRGTCLGTLVNFNTGCTYRQLLNTVKKTLRGDWWDCFALCSSKGNSYITRYVDL